MSKYFKVRPVAHRGITPDTKQVPYINEVPMILAYLKEIDAERDEMLNMDIAMMDMRIRADMDDLRVIWLIFNDGDYKHVGMCSLQAMHNPTFEKYNYYLDDFHLIKEYQNEYATRKFYKLVRNWVVLNDGGQILGTLENSNKTCRDFIKKTFMQERECIMHLDNWSS